MDNTFRPVQPGNGGIGDKVRLLGVALIVCVVGVSCFLFAEKYRFDTFWVFVTLGSILLVAIVSGRYPGVVHRTEGRIFLGLWALVHGILTAIMIVRAVAMTFWLPVFVFEFFVGFSIMRRLDSPR